MMKTPLFQDVELQEDEVLQEGVGVQVVVVSKVVKLSLLSHIVMKEFSLVAEKKTHLSPSI